MQLRLKHILAFLWIAAIGGVYLSLYPLSGILSSLPAPERFVLSLKPAEHIFCVFLFFICANGWGSLFWSNTHLTHLERLLFATASGFGVISLLIFFFLAVGITGSTFYFIVLLIGFALFVGSGRRVHRVISSNLTTTLLLSVLAVLCTLIGALAPATQFDSLVYHLALPAKYLAAGRMHAVPYNMFFSFPQGMEMLYMMAIKLDSDISANLLHWIFLPLGACAVYSFSHRFWGERTALVSSVIWMFTPAAMFVSTGTYVDLALAFYVFMAFYALMIFRQTGRRLFIYVSALISGFACGIKYTALIPVAIMSFMILFLEHVHSPDEAAAAEHEDMLAQAEPAEERPLRRGFGYRLKNSIFYLAIVTALFFPWLLKNYVYLNNPIAPWGTAVFGSQAVDREGSANYFRHIAGHGVRVSGLRDLALLPFSVTFYGYEFGGGFDILGPAFLILVPILFLRMKIDRMEKTLLLFCAAFLAAWIVSGKVLRFLLPVIPFLCLLSARGSAIFYDNFPNRIVQGVFAALLALILAHNLLIYQWVMASVDPWSAVFGGLSDSQYLSRKVNYYPAAEAGLNSLGQKSTTVFLGETRSYYCNGNVIAPTDFDRNPLITGANETGSAGALRDYLKAGKITHVFVNNREFERLSMGRRFTQKGLANWSGLKAGFTQSIYKDGYCELYAITY